MRRPFHRGGGCPCAAIYRKPMSGRPWPFTGGRYRLALAIYRKSVPPAGGHASATFTGPEGFPDRRVHTSAIYRKVYPCRRVPATAIYRKVDPDRRVACAGQQGTG